MPSEARTDEIQALRKRVEEATGPDNALDMEVDIALFKADERHIAVRTNGAGTKLIYTCRDGRHETFWAADHTLSPETRARAAAILRALEETGRG